MKKYLVVLAALSVMIVGCGKEEEPKPPTETAMQEEKAAAMESEKPAEAMAEAPAKAEEPMAEAAAGAEGATMEEGAPAMEQPMAAAEKPAEEAAAPMGEMAVAQAEGGKGKQIYDSVCFACHAQGIAGAPKIGDKALWEPRIAQGMDTLVSHAINGFQGSTGVMPAKGGRVDLSDEDVKAAVSYMVDQAK